MWCRFWSMASTRASFSALMAPSTATATGPLAAAAIRLVAVGALLDTTITELLDCCSFVASNIR